MFDQNGYASASLEQIAEAAGMTKGPCTSTSPPRSVWPTPCRSTHRPPSPTSGNGSARPGCLRCRHSSISRTRWPKCSRGTRWSGPASASATSAPAGGLARRACGRRGRPRCCGWSPGPARPVICTSTSRRTGPRPCSAPSSADWSPCRAPHRAPAGWRTGWRHSGRSCCPPSSRPLTPHAMTSAPSPSSGKPPAAPAVAGCCSPSPVRGPARRSCRRLVTPLEGRPARACSAPAPAGSFRRPARAGNRRRHGSAPGRREPEPAFPQRESPWASGATAALDAGERPDGGSGHR
ncbi:hypothetical protein OIM90_31670 [Streptomyces sp. AD16]|nr:hypothetical protein OIM90_31670 [Streptomyces sp. AD16]